MTSLYAGLQNEEVQYPYILAYSLEAIKKYDEVDNDPSYRRGLLEFWRRIKIKMAAGCSDLKAH